MMAAADQSYTVVNAPRGGLRLLISLLVMLHVAAVFVGPWSMPPQTSPLAMFCATLIKPYLDGLSLSNGYRFFAPEPGPSHLLRYEVLLDDGRQVQGVFPDKQTHQPRLLYHRYFMLSEFLNTLENPSAPHELAEAYARSYAQHLLHQYQGKSVKLYLRRHYVPRMDEVIAGRKLSDPALYEERPVVTYERDTS